MHSRLSLACVTLVLFAVGLVQPPLAVAASVPATVTPLTPAVVPKTVATMPLDATHILTISASDLDVKLASTVTAARVFDTTQQTFGYTLEATKAPAGALSLTVRTLPSGSKMIFADLEARNAPAAVTLAISSISQQAVLHDLGLKPVLTPNKVQGVDYTSGPIGWIDFSRGAASDAPLFLSKAYRYDILTKSYPNGGLSTVRELVSETPTMTIVQDGVSPVTVDLGLDASSAQHCERYFLISSSEISDTLVQAYSVARVMGDEWRWLDPLGSYDKAPYSIEPATKRGYVRSLVDMRGSETLAAYRATRSALFGDMLVNDLYTLGAVRSPDGLWRTDYTSTWVKAESGIVAPYVDTRHNEHLSELSLSIAESLGSRGVIAVAECTKWADVYAAYLSGRAAAGAVVRTPHGMLFADYYDASGKLKVHTSLNHALGEMNYLYDMYLRTADYRYVDLAEQVRAGIDDTAPGWIRPNHDLYYQRNLNGTFSGTDYPVVTYMDLLGARMRIFGIMGEIDPAIEQLLASKAAFLGVRPDRLVADAGATQTPPSGSPQEMQWVLPGALSAPHAGQRFSMWIADVSPGRISATGASPFSSGIWSGAGGSIASG